MKITKRDLGLLLGLLGLLLVVAAYSLVFTPTRDKVAEVEAQIKTLKVRENELLDMEKNMAFYQEQTKKLEKQAEDLMVYFPAEIKPENEIMYAVELESEVDVEFSSLNYGSPTEIAPSNNNAGVTGYVTALSLSYRASYRGLKDVILYTAEKEDRMVVDTVTASFDSSTGRLLGSMTINMYTLDGTEKMYEKPYVPAMYIGVDNIFGTFEGAND